MKEKPIAESAEMKEAVAELLNFDDGVFVDYTQGITRLSVYIAYWQPGRMSHRLIAGHTPDVCWVGGGWKKVHAGSTTASAVTAAYDAQLNLLLSVATTQAHAIPTGEGRTFTEQGTTKHVWFWHLVDQESKSYGTGTPTPWYATIRISSPRASTSEMSSFLYASRETSPSARAKPALSSPPS